jgi:hypothetical protein
MTDSDDIHARLELLEARVLGRARGPRLDPSYDRRISKREMALRRGTSTKTVERDTRRGVLPPPEIDPHGHWFWWLSAIQQHERAQANVTREPRVMPPRRTERTR